MNIELALSIPLTTYGNVILNTSHRRTASIALARYLEDFGHLSRMKSVRFGRAEAENNVVRATRKWLYSLKRKGAQRLWIVTLKLKQELPEHLSEAFAGTNPKGILVECSNKQELLVPDWHTTRGSKSQVSYQSFPIDAKYRTLAVRSAISSLRKALNRASEFAKQTQPQWCEWFANSLKKLGDRKSETDYLPQEGFPQDARRLIAGANHACVFGGMGSWNDMAFRGRQQQEYEQISTELYAAVMNGLLTAAYSFDPALLDR